ncbi:SusC/RagA family TonB-linked outer membrane protein [Halalkalibaculum sp. DA3122]
MPFLISGQTVEAQSGDDLDATYTQRLSSVDYVEVEEGKYRTFNFEFRKTPFKDALQKVAEKGNYKLLFNHNLVWDKRKVTMEMNQVNLREAFNRILGLTPLDFVVAGNGYIIITQKVENMKTKVQIETVTGVVTDANTGETMPGVNVVVKGTTTGTSTNSEGRFELNVPSLQDTLVFSFVGYQRNEVPINGRTQLNVNLQSEAISGEEIVVTGYGTQARREVTGSIASVESEQINQVSESSLENALQGQVAGLQMTQTGGSPTQMSRIVIRGINSISAGTEPLIVIDGMPVNGSHQDAGGMDQGINPLSLVNPNDIESIEVLKDAAATAIYGSRGSNGVILISTKDGRRGAGTFDMNYQTGFSTPVGTYDLLDTSEWLEIVDLARANNPNNLDPFDPLSDYDWLNLPPEGQLDRQEIQNINTDWFDRILRPGQFHSLNVSSSGGTEGGTSYYVSANYRTDEGYLKTNNMNRIVTRANVDLAPLENLTAGIRTNFTFLQQDEVPVNGGPPCCNDQVANGNWTQAVSGALPWLPVYNDQGELFHQRSGNNLVATLHDEWYTSWSRNLRTLGKIFADYQIPNFDNLEIHSEISLDYKYNNALRSATGDLRPSGEPYGRQQGSEAWSYNYNIYGTYQDSFLGLHNIKVTAGTEAFSENSLNSFLEALNRTATDEMIGSPGGSSIQRLSFNRSRETRFIGYFARANYNYQGRYIAQFSIRRDGSSVFGADKQFGTFPAGSVGWVISDEPFMQNVDFLSFLKLRGSYGLTGNANIPTNAKFNSFAGWKRYGSVPVGYYFNQVGSQEVGWETTESTDVGFEFGILNDRITGNVSYYKQDVTDMLLASPIAQSNGTASEQIWANIGDLQNQGFEISVNSQNVAEGDFSWRTELNLTLNDNEVLSLTPVISDNNSGLRQGVTNTRIGQGIGLYFMAESAGLNPDTGYEMIYAVDNDPFLVNDNGEYVDQNGNVISEENRINNPNFLETTDEMIPATESNVSNNRTLMEGKSGIPTYYGGLTNTLSYKGFDFTFTLNFQGGNYIYDQVLQGKTRPAGTGNYSTELLGNYWTENNRNARYPKPSWNNQYMVDGSVESFGTQTSMYLYKADFLRLRRVRIGYNLPPSILNTLNMRGLEIYLSGTNLWTYAPHHPGLDPEVTSFGNPEQRNLNPGVLGTGYLPPSQQFSLGVNLSF